VKIDNTRNVIIIENILREKSFYNNTKDKQRKKIITMRGEWKMKEWQDTKVKILDELIKLSNDLG